MKRDSKLSSVLHVLLHLAHSDRPMTSEQMAGMLGKIGRASCRERVF